MNTLKLFTLGIFTASALMLSGCGGGGGGSTLKNEYPKEGTNDLLKAYYIDSPVQGIDYICDSNSGKTDNKGTFFFKKGDNCIFSIGQITLRKVSSNELSNEQIILEDNYIIAQLLQSLDNDGNQTNGILITDKVKNILEQFNTPKTSEEVKRIQAEIENKVSTYNGRFISYEEAKSHLETTKAEISGSFKSDSKGSIDVNFLFFLDKELITSIKSNKIYLYNYDEYFSSIDEGNSWNKTSKDELDSIVNSKEIEKTLNDIKTKAPEIIDDMESIILGDDGKTFISVYNFSVYSYKDGKLIKLDENSTSKNFTFPSTVGTLFYDNNNKILYAGTYWNGVYKYTNGKWYEFSKGLPKNAGVSQIIMDSDDNLFAILKDQSKSYGVYKYIDNSWISFNNNLTKGNLDNIESLHASNRKIFIKIHNRGFFKTDPTSSNWIDINRKNDFYPQEIEKTLKIKDKNLLLALSGQSFFGYSIIYLSKNDGKNWIEFSTSMYSDDTLKNKFNSIMDIEILNDTLYASTYEGELFSTKIDFPNWKAVYSNFNSTPNDIAIDETKGLIYINTFWDGVLRSDDKGRTFISLDSPDKSKMDYNSKIYIKNGNIFLERAGKKYKSDNEGESWILVN